MLVVAVLSQVAGWTTGAVPAPIAALAASLLVAAWALTGTLRGHDPTLRRAASLLAVVGALAFVPTLLSPGESGLRGALGPMLVAVQVAQSLTWLSRRELQTGLVVAVGMLVLDASQVPDVLAGLPLVAGWIAAVHALLRLQATTAAAPTSGPRRYWAVARRAARPPLLAAVALALVLGLVAFLLVPQVHSPRQRAALGRGGDSGSSAGPAASARAASLSGDRVDLTTRGRLGDRVLAEVDDTSAPLWRSASFDTWDGTAWTASGPAERVLLRGQPIRVPDAPDGPTRLDRVRVPDAIGSTVVWSPGLAVSVNTSVPVAVHDATGAVTLPQTGNYEVRSVPLVSDPARLRRAAAAAAPRYLQLPSTTTDRVRALAVELTASAPTAHDKVLAVERWLDDHNTYRLDSPVPRPGEDAVDRFLFVDHEGFCEQFAAAETVLLRAAGVPARFVVGLAYGEPNPRGGRLFRERMLHAWVEVPYEGLGWAASDPTASAAQSLGRSSLRTRAATRLAGLLRAVDRLPGGRIAVAGLLLALVVMTVLVRGWRPRRRAAATAPLRPVSDGPLLDAYLRWDAALGDARRRGPESLTEQRARMLLSKEQVAALRAVEQECFGASPVAPDDEERARTALLQR